MWLSDEAELEVRSDFDNTTGCPISPGSQGYFHIIKACYTTTPDIITHVLIMMSKLVY